MSTKYVFADEAGDRKFNRKSGSSLYFVIASCTVTDCGIGDELLALRRRLALNGTALRQFHATEDRQWVRNAVYERIATADCRLDATIFEKPKTQDHLRRAPIRFLKEAWYLHFKYLIPRIVKVDDELLVVAADFKVKGRTDAIAEALEDVIAQVSPTDQYATAFLPSACEPCLQVADYAAWAMGRLYELNDDRPFTQVRTRVHSRFEPFKSGDKTYY